MDKPIKQKDELPPVFGNGLVVTDHGLRGLVFETTSAHHLAERRHERVIDLVDTCMAAPPGGLLLILLVVNDMVLTIASLKAAVSLNAQVYGAGGLQYLEWSTGNGWIERRELSTRSVDAIEGNGGCAVSDADWRWATRTLRGLQPGRPPHDVWPGFFADAQSWWVTRLTGPVFGHVAGLRPFQLLTRAALARRETGQPQLSAALMVTSHPDDLALVQTARSHSKATSTFDGLIVFAGQVARDKGSKDHGRGRIIEHIQMLLPLSGREGRVQVIVLGATRHAIETGGVRGDKWAPITIYEYLRQGLKELVVELIEADIDDLSGWAWLEIYEQILKKIRESQRPKFAAFLEVFHRFLVIAGFDPLPRCLSGNGSALPPAASVVWPHELERAIAFIEANVPSGRMRLQATVGLVLAFWVPLRTVELWCIRVGDVHLKDQVYLTIYPRRRDGVGKTPSVRRQEGVEDMQLKALLIDMVRLRRQDDADDDDVLLGEPGKPGARHEELVTTQLINAALRWATGDTTASFYDLRHTAFSRRAEPVLLGGTVGTDVAAFQQVAAQGGHAGPSSTSAYIHWVENAIAALSRASRPQSLGLASACTGMFRMEDIGKGLISVERTPLVPPVAKEPVLVTSAGLTLAKRADIIWRVSKNLPIESVAGACDVLPNIVHKVVADLVQTMVQIELVRHSAAASARRQCQAINSMELWARAARQPKNELIGKALSAQLSVGEWSKLRLLWQDWNLCHSGDFLSLANPRPAVRIIEFLLNAGVQRQSLVIVSSKNAPPLPIELGNLKIEPRSVDPRKGRALHRLFMSKNGVRARDANAATISMVGLHWWMVVLGSILLERGEI